MSVFRRRSGRHSRGDEPRGGREATTAAEVEADLAEEELLTDPLTGPYDAADAPDDEIQRLDLGSLHLAAVPDVEVRMQADNEGQIASVILVHADSALQIGVFAAPRSAGIWDEVRADIAASVKADGGRFTEEQGEFGTELRARVPTPEGPTTLRFIGVDGPRWFLRGLFQGRAAQDAVAAKPLVAAVRQSVVVRDKEARPVREPLPLRLPPGFAEQAAAQTESQPPAPSAQAAAPQPGSRQVDGAPRRRQDRGPRSH